MLNEIIQNVLREMRRERKIIMAITDSNYIKEYVTHDIEKYTEFINDSNKTIDDFDPKEYELEGNPKDILKIITDKKFHKDKYIKKLSNLKLKYIFNVLRVIH